VTEAGCKDGIGAHGGIRVESDDGCKHPVDVRTGEAEPAHVQQLRGRRSSDRVEPLPGLE